MQECLQHFEMKVFIKITMNGLLLAHPYSYICFCSIQIPLFSTWCVTVYRKYVVYRLTLGHTIVMFCPLFLGFIIKTKHMTHIEKTD